MPPTGRNVLLIALFFVIFAVVFIIEAQQTSVPSMSTTAGMGHGAPLH